MGMYILGIAKVHQGNDSWAPTSYWNQALQPASIFWHFGTFCLLWCWVSTDLPKMICSLPSLPLELLWPRSFSIGIALADLTPSKHPAAACQVCQVCLGLVPLELLWRAWQTWDPPQITLKQSAKFARYAKVFVQLEMLRQTWQTWDPLK